MGRWIGMLSAAGALGLLVGCGEGEDEDLELLHTETVTVTLEGIGPWAVEVFPLESVLRDVSPSQAVEAKVVGVGFTADIDTTGYLFRLRSEGVEVARVTNENSTTRGVTIPLGEGASFTLDVDLEVGFAANYELVLEVEVWGNPPP